MQLVLGVTVVFVVSVNELLDWCHAVSTGCDGRVCGLTPSTNCMTPVQWFIHIDHKRDCHTQY